MNIAKERYMYYTFIFLMVLAHSGLPLTRYSVYVIPVFAVVIWLAGGKPKLNFNIIITPFVFLLVLSVFSIIPWDYNTFKKAFFIFVFTTVFLLFDFSKIKIDFKKLALFFILLAFFMKFVMGSGMSNIEFNFLDSRSAFESTFAFPIGLIALYFIVIRKYIIGLVFFAVSILFLKRIVLIAIVLSLLVWFLPEKFRKYILNPLFTTTAAVFVTILSINFAFGNFDGILFDLTDKSANDLSKGRQSLWSSTLLAVDFTYQSFIIWGVGIGKVLSSIENILHVKGVLLHNDLLSLVLEIGFIFFVIFVFLLNSVKSAEQRLVALFITMLFITDNVLIYQHMMFVYLLIQQSLLVLAYSDGSKEKSSINVVSPKSSRILKLKNSRTYTTNVN